MQYPNENQAALLFPGTMRDLETVVRSVLRILEARGAKFNVPRQTRKSSIACSVATR